MTRSCQDGVTGCPQQHGIKAKPWDRKDLGAFLFCSTFARDD